MKRPARVRGVLITPSGRLLTIKRIRCSPFNGVEENVLRCPVGAADVMRHRFDHLQEVASHPWPTALFSGGAGSTNKPSIPAHSARGAGAVHTTAAVIDQQPPRRHILLPGPPLIHPASGPR